MGCAAHADEWVGKRAPPIRPSDIFPQSVKVYVLGNYCPNGQTQMLTELRGWVMSISEEWASKGEIPPPNPDRAG